VPGVESTAIALGAPFSRSNPVSSFDMPGTSPAVEDQAALRVVGGDYFRSLGIPVVAGRDFDRRDAPTAPPVAIVNQAFVREFMNGVSPIGQSIDVHARLTRDAPDADRTVIGVVGDVRQRSLSNAPQPDIFVPYTQHPVNLGLVIVKASANPDVLVNTLRARLRALDPDLPLAQPATMDALIGQTTVQQRFTGLLLAIFAGVAVLLAAVGLYGVLAYDVTHRTREIGVRMALGAEPGSVLRLFLREGALVAVAGALVGVTGAWLAGGYLESLLFGVTASDPLTLAMAAGVVLALAAAASLIPARRATRLDPVQALRD
jgi:putative ABC transport system permease protein